MPIELDHTLVPSHHKLAAAKLLAEFDAILAGLRAAGIAFRSSVRGPMGMQVNTDDGGNRVYWNEPDGQMGNAHHPLRTPGRVRRGHRQSTLSFKETACSITSVWASATTRPARRST